MRAMSLLRTADVNVRDKEGCTALHRASALPGLARLRRALLLGDAVPLQEQIATGVFTVRVHITFVSPFRALDVAERNLHMYSVVTQNMERKIERLERALQTIIPRHDASWSNWNAPETEVEPTPAAKPTPEAVIPDAADAPAAGPAADQLEKGGARLASMRDLHMRTPLHHAALAGCLEACQQLLDAASFHDADRPLGCGCEVKVR
eukprot:s1803_g22.t1